MWRAEEIVPSVVAFWFRQGRQQWVKQESPAQKPKPHLQCLPEACVEADPKAAHDAQLKPVPCPAFVHSDVVSVIVQFARAYCSVFSEQHMPRALKWRVSDDGLSVRTTPGGPGVIRLRDPLPMDCSSTWWVTWTRGGETGRLATALGVVRGSVPAVEFQGTRHPYRDTFAGFYGIALAHRVLFEGMGNAGAKMTKKNWHHPQAKTGMRLRATLEYRKAVPHCVLVFVNETLDPGRIIGEEGTDYTIELPDRGPWFPCLGPYQDQDVQIEFL